jgi:hypothetical protein
MPSALEAQTCLALTSHEEISDQCRRLTGDLWQEYEETVRARKMLANDRNFRLIVTSPASAASPDNAVRKYVALSFSGSVAGAIIERERESEAFHKCLQRLGDRSFTIFSAWGTARLSTLHTDVQSSARKRHFKNRLLSARAKWTDDKNRRRCELVDKEIEGELTPAEGAELQLLQAEMLAYRRKLAPLPLAEVRALHEELIREIGDRVQED